MKGYGNAGIVSLGVTVRVVSKGMSIHLLSLLKNTPNPGLSIVSEREIEPSSLRANTFPFSASADSTAKP